MIGKFLEVLNFNQLLLNSTSSYVTSSRFSPFIELVGLGNTRVMTDYAQKCPRAVICYPHGPPSSTKGHFAPWTMKLDH